MSESMYHPTLDRLEAYVEGFLDHAETVVIQSHVLGCTRCQTEIDEVKTLFVSLASLQRFEPAPGFMNRVMAQVRVAEPWHARAGAYLQGFVPRSKRGWAFASSIFAIPLASFAALMLWLLSKPYVTGEGLIAFTLNQVGTGVSGSFRQVGSALLHSSLTLWFARGIELAFGAGLRGTGAVAALFAGLTALSAWVLYKNLFRTPHRGSDYASYSF